MTDSDEKVRLAAPSLDLRTRFQRLTHQVHRIIIDDDRFNCKVGISFVLCYRYARCNRSFMQTSKTHTMYGETFKFVRGVISHMHSCLHL